MRKALHALMAVLLLIFSLQLAVNAQTYGAIAGTVVDQNGAVVPNATVVVRGQRVRQLEAERCLAASGLAGHEHDPRPRT
jgi:hypothetical protein